MILKTFGGPSKTEFLVPVTTCRNTKAVLVGGYEGE